ncbi:Enhancer of polycomb-like protein 1 [Nowakowskiella sp. JEL0078]|nr:Enhancer of polycomb-like protein 1 [Nowakowskiella sp. JEL0078]
MDEEDDEWLRSYNGKCAETGDSPLGEDDFEKLMDVAERLGNQKMWAGMNDPATLDELFSFIKEDNINLNVDKSSVTNIFQYWKSRRFDVLGGNPVLALLKVDETGPRSDSDPYVCFRKREIRTLRKTRKYDSQSLDKLKRLRDEIAKAQEILENVTQREILRKESLMLEQQVFEQRILVKRLKKKLGIVSEREVSPTRKKKDRIARIRLTTRSDGDVYSRDMVSGDERAKQHKNSEEAKGWMDLTEDPYVPVHFASQGASLWRRNLPLPIFNFLSVNSSTKDKIPIGRRRIGRGGRVMIDRHIEKNLMLSDPTPKIPFGYHVPFANNGAKLTVLTNDEENMKNKMSRWEFDNSDDELEDEVIEIDDCSRYIGYRAFNLLPAHTQLMNKPTYPEQVDPLRQPSLSSSNKPIPPTAVTPNSASTPTTNLIVSQPPSVPITTPTGLPSTSALTTASEKPKSKKIKTVSSVENETNVEKPTKNGKKAKLSQIETSPHPSSPQQPPLSIPKPTLQQRQSQPHSPLASSHSSLTPSSPLITKADDNLQISLTSTVPGSPPTSPSKQNNMVEGSSLFAQSSSLQCHSPLNTTFPLSLPSSQQSIQQQLLQRRQSLQSSNGINSMSINELQQIYLQQQQEAMRLALYQQQRLNSLQLNTVSTSMNGSSTPPTLTPDISFTQLQHQQYLALKLLAAQKGAEMPMEGSVSSSNMQDLIADIGMVLPQSQQTHSLA